ncbi:MAG TPA: MBL fold metallo-hydrolase [Polyangiaceae bacterium]|jgi:L-ascorbate metabolism protein UlaG (beta-lactamase superfamily)
MRRSFLVLLLALAAVALVGCEDPRLQHVQIHQPLPAQTAAVAFAGPRVTDRFPTTDGDLAVVPLEHASLLLGWQGKAIYVDPTAPAVNDPSLPTADVILVTDAHYDHLDPVVVSQLRHAGTIVLGPASASERAPMDVVLHEGDARDVAGLHVTAVPAYNIERGPVPGVRYHERGRGIGYLLEAGGLRVYLSGETDCTPEVRALERVDVAFVGMNVPYAMTPAEASACVGAFHPRVVVPYAYRHADLRTLDRGAMGPGVVLLRRSFYPRADRLRREAYDGMVHGMWGLADDRLDEAKALDPEGDAEWRVVMTRQWLKEYERVWPF